LPCLTVVTFGPAFFAWFLGPEWREAGEQSRWLILWLGVGFCNVPAVTLLRVLRVQGQFLFYQIILFICRCMALVIGCRLSGAGGGIIAFSVVGALFNSGLIAWVYWLLRTGHAHRQRSFDEPEIPCFSVASCVSDE
jgi:O-antigen/teichoic acid export membrane protein